MVRQARQSYKNVTMDGHASLIRITERAKRCPIDPIRVFLDQSPLRRLSAYFLHFTCSLVLDRFISIASSLIPYLDIHSVTSDDYPIDSHHIATSLLILVI